jgi:hypothetical protein
MTEVIAAEAAAALAAEAAAAEAAKIAAAEAASVVAAEAASTAAAQAAAQAATQQVGTQAGIMGIEGAAANAPLTAEATQAAAMQSGLPPGFEQQLQNVQNLGQGPSVQVASADPSAGIRGLQGSTAQELNIAAAQQAAGITPPPPPAPVPQGLADPSLAAPPQNAGFFGSPSAAPGQGPMQYQLNAPTTNQGVRLGSSLEGITAPTTPMTTVQPPPSALETGMDKATKFAQKNPFTAMTGAYLGANALGLMDPSGATFNNDKYDGPLNKYRLSPDFRGSNANPEDFQYTPRRYASGGVMDAGPVQAMSDQNNSLGYQQGIAATGGQVASFAKGGSLSESIEKYQKMMDGEKQAAPAKSADVGIYYDQDPDTRYQDALTAAQIRQAKVNQRAYVSPPAAKRPAPMGQLQMASVKAAQGGVMQSYADGGITGNGNLNLNIPLNLGGGGAGGGFGGYTPAGGGNVNPNTGGGGFGGLGGMLAGMGGTAENGYKSPGGMGGDGSNIGSMLERLNQMQKDQANNDGILGRGLSHDLPPGHPQYDNYFARFARGGIADSNLGGYAAGGNPRLLKGPGDGMSDNIPATINGRQPARLADGEFVIPADVVSHLGNGSTEAGAKQLHAMMNKIRKARTGNPKQGKQINPSKFLPK